MSIKYYDIIIIGSGISGLYSAYNIKQVSPETSFVILEKYKKQWIGGRTSNESFYGTQIVTGAGIGRKNKDKLLRSLLNELHIQTEEFVFTPYFSKLIQNKMNIKEVIDYLKTEYNKSINRRHITFKEFAKPLLGREYNSFLMQVGYTDYENEDAYEVIYNYGMDDNTCCWKGLYVPWRKLVMALYNKIESKHVKTSMNVISITKKRENPCTFLVETEEGLKFECNRVIVATTITGIRKILQGASSRNSIYNYIQGQNFLRLYAKFSKHSSQIMREYIKGYTIVPGPLQKVIPMDPDNGVYMIAYSDNLNASFLKNHLANNTTNHQFFAGLLEKSLGMPHKSLDIIEIKDFYWPIGTHYYTPLPIQYNSRVEFIHKAQHPEKGILVVGEVVSENQGWVEGALSSVKKVLTKKWIKTLC